MEAPKGIDGNTPPPLGANPVNHAALPGDQVANAPALPNVNKALTASEPVPAAWNDPIRIMREVLDVLEKNGPEAASSLLAWVNQERTK